MFLVIKRIVLGIVLIWGYVSTQRLEENRCSKQLWNFYYKLDFKSTIMQLVKIHLFPQSRSTASVWVQFCLMSVLTNAFFLFAVLSTSSTRRSSSCCPSTAWCTWWRSFPFGGKTDQTSLHDSPESDEPRRRQLSITRPVQTFFF